MHAVLNVPASYHSECSSDNKFSWNLLHAYWIWHLIVHRFV